MRVIALALALLPAVQAGHDSWSCIDETIFPDTCCVVVTRTDEDVKNLPGGNGAIAVGMTALGAAGGDGVPRVACVASKGSYPEMLTDILALGPITSGKPALASDGGAQYCNEYDSSTISNFWGQTPVTNTIHGALDGESDEEAIARLYEAGVATALATDDDGNVIVTGQITDYANSALGAALDTPWATLSCPRLGGPTCPDPLPDGVTCPDGFSARGGTEAGYAFYLGGEEEMEEEADDESGAFSATLLATSAISTVAALIVL